MLIAACTHRKADNAEKRDPRNRKISLAKQMELD